MKSEVLRAPENSAAKQVQEEEAPLASLSALLGLGKHGLARTMNGPGARDAGRVR